MEIFNNLLNALTTPNEGLINIILIIGAFIESFFTIELFISILNIKTSKYQTMLYVALLSIIGLITLFIIPAPLNNIINLVTAIIAAYIIFRNSFFKTIAGMIISLITLNLAVILVLNPYITICNITSEILSTIPLYKLCYMLTVYTILSITILLIKARPFKLDILEFIDKNNKIIIGFNLLFGILAIGLQIIILFYYVNNLPLLINFASFLSILVYFGISIYSLSKVLKLTLTTKKLESAEEYNNTLRILHENVSGFKHDFDNIVTTIGGYVKTNDMEGLKNYYVQLEDDCQKVNNLYVLNPDIVNNDGIYNLLTKKYHEAESKDVKVNITFLLDLSTLHMKIYEFARILGILLDNAIEASSECDEKTINLIFRDDTKNSRQLITIENTYKNKDVDTERIFEKGISGKNSHTGLGLWEVRKILKKNNNSNLHTSKNDKFFSQQLEIYY